jgi:hypothetical protein
LFPPFQQKFQLRSALISSPSPTPKSAYAVSFCIETRSADDIELSAWLDVVAGGSPALGSIATKGPFSKDADPALKSFLLLEYLNYPEASMLDALASNCWKVAQLPRPEKFRLEFYNHSTISSQIEVTKPATDNDENNVETNFVIEGSGEELKVLLMVLAGLESGELLFGTGDGQTRKKKALTPWIPNNERIQVRRLQDGNSYEMRAALGNNSEDKSVVVLSSRQVRAVIDCLDAFCELHPSFGLSEPPLEWPRTPLLRQLAATLNF